MLIYYMLVIMLFYMLAGNSLSKLMRQLKNIENEKIWPMILTAVLFVIQFVGGGYSLILLIDRIADMCVQVGPAVNYISV